MDLRKEIKLSDLVPKRSRKPKPPKEAAKQKQKPARGRRGRGRNASGQLEIVGLKVGATGMTAAHVVNNGGKQVVRLAHEQLPIGVVDGGEVRDPAALGEALAGFFAAHKLPRRGVRLGLANSRIGVRVIEIAGIEDEKQLENAIGFRAHEMLSVPVDEAVIDYRVLDEDTDEDGTITRRILLVVAYRESVDRYLAAVDAAKLELAGIDLEAFALLRAVSEPAIDGEEGHEPTSAITALNVGHERSTLAISNGTICDFTRVLGWGGAEIGSALARALKISPSEAEDLKRGLSLEPGSEGIDDLPDHQAAEAIDAVRYELQTLVRELLSSLRFYQSQPGSLPIGEILVAGGTTSIPGFAAELERELGIRVRVADPLARVNLGEGVELPEHPAAVAIALGLGIED